MPAQFKVDATKRVIRAIQVLEVYTGDEKRAHLLGMRAMARICAGENSGVYRLIAGVVDGEIKL